MQTIKNSLTPQAHKACAHGFVHIVYSKLRHWNSLLVCIHKKVDLVIAVAWYIWIHSNSHLMLNSTSVLWGQDFSWKDDTNENWLSH